MLVVADNCADSTAAIARRLGVAVIERHDSTVRVRTHGVPDRIIYSAPRAKQLAALGLDATGIADRVRALRETEALAG